MIKLSQTSSSIPFNPRDSRLTSSNLNDAVLEANTLLEAEEAARVSADTAILASAQAYVLAQLSSVSSSLFIDGGPASEAYFDSNYVIDGGSAT